MKQMTCALVGMLALAGCMTREEQIAGFRDRCQQEYGHAPGTPAMAQCVQAADIARQQAIGRALAAPR